jgi:hypothetical protein
VQIDFTEGRLAVKLDPSGKLLSSFIALINRILDQFSEEERKRINSRASLAFTRALLPPEGNPTGAPVKT